MTWEERMYMRAIMARDQSWAKALAQEMAVAPHKGDGRFMFYWDANGNQKIVPASQWEVEQFCESLRKEWRDNDRPAFD